MRTRKHRKIVIKASLWVFLCLLPGITLAQGTGTISGKVFDAKTGLPLPGAVVLATPQNLGATVSESGTFELKGLTTGNHLITASYLGYAVKELPVQLGEGENRLVDIYLNPAPNILKMVIIKDQYIREIPYIQHTLMKEEIEMMAVRDIGDQLRMLPNVGGIKKGAVNIDPVVRGFKFSQITTLLDGAIAIEGGCPNRMDPTSSHIALDDLAEMQVLKGPFALRFGSVFGGVVNLVPVKPVPFETFEVKVKGVKAYESNWNGHREYASVMGGNKKYYFLVSGYQMKYGDYLDGNGVRFITNNHKFGYKAALGFRPLPNHEALISFSNSMSKGIMFPALPMDDRKDDSRVIYFDYKIGKVNNWLNSVDFKVYSSLVDHTMDNKQKPFSDTTAAISHIIAEALGGRLETGLNLFGGHMYLGVDQKSIRKDGDRVKNMILQNPMNGKVPVKTELLYNEAEMHNLGFFAEFKRRINRLDLIAAARFDMNSAKSDTILLYGGTLMAPTVLISNPDTESKHTGLSLSAGATYNFNEKFSASLAMGRGVRFPDMLERFIISLPVGFDQFEYMGNPKLNPEINNEVDVNFRYNHRTYGGFDLTFFYSFVQDYIMGERLPVSQQRPLTDNVYGVKVFKNFETALFRGFEFAYKSPEKYKLGVSAVASYTQGTIAKTVKPIIDPTQPPLQSIIGEEVVNNDPAPEIPPFEGTLQLKYKLFGNKLIPTASWRFVAAQNIVSEAYFESTTPSFSVISMGLAYQHSKNLTLSGGVNNLLDVAYYEHLSRRIIGSTLNFYEPGRVFYINAIINL